MLDAIGTFIARQVAGYSIKKGLDWFPDKNRETFERRLAGIIDKTIDDFSRTLPKPVEGVVFYESRVFVDELLKYRLFGNDGDMPDRGRIESALRAHVNIAAPGTEAIRAFLTAFEENLKADDELRKLALQEGYQEEIFRISERFADMDGKLDRLLENTEEIKRGMELPRSAIAPKELTALNRIPAREIIGRDKDLEALREALLRKSETALINGMGGIGKTTLAGAYIDRYYDDYDHIGWLTMEGSLEEAVMAEYTLHANLNVGDVEPGNQVEACLNVLRNLKGEKKNLLVMDNASEEIGKYYDRLPKAPNWHVLVTSRERVAPFHIMDIDFLGEDDAMALFARHNGAFIPDEVRRIVNHVELHTLTIEVLAKSAKQNRWDFDKVLKAIGTDARAHVTTFHSKHGKIERIQSYLTDIFRTSNLGDRRIWLLKQFVCLPNAWVEYGLLSRLLSTGELDWEEDFPSTLESLYEKGFLLKNEGRDSYKMHAVLAEALKPQLNVALSDIELLLPAVAELLDLDQAKENPIDKFPFIPYGDAIARLFPADDSPRMSVLRHNLGLRCSELGDYEKARDLLEQALESELKNFGPDQPNVAIGQLNLANVYKDLGDYEKARDLLKQALESVLKNFGPDHPTVAISRSNLANVYRDLGDYEKARDLLEQALESDLKNFGPDHPTVATRQSNLANVYGNLGDYEKARDLLKQALESDLKNFGPDHPTVATRQSNLANVYRDLGDYEKARDLLEQALESDLKNFGPDHPTVATSRSNLAIVYRDLGHYEKARDLLKQALESVLKNFGPDHPDVATIRSNLAIVYGNLGDYEKARDLLKQALESVLKNFGPDHPDVATIRSNLAIVYGNLGDYEKARDLLKQALESVLKNFGPDHPDVATRQSNLANVYGNLGDYEKARDLLEQALESGLKNFGPDHPNVATIRLNLANVYRDIGDYDKARDLWTRAYEIFKNALGLDHPHTKMLKGFLEGMKAR